MRVRTVRLPQHRGVALLLNALDPQLEHNLRRFKQFGRHSRILGIAATAIYAVSMMARPSMVNVVAWIVTLVVGFGYFEVRRTMVFMKDLRERRQSDAA